MKKLFLSLMLVAGLAAGFSSCQKLNDSGTHSQTFTLESDTCDIQSAITIENIKYEDSDDIYNALILSNGEFTGNAGNGKGVIIVFKDEISEGIYDLSNDLTTFPKYLYTNVAVDDIVSFDLADLQDDDDVYVAYTGSLTIEIIGDEYTVTTKNVEVENAINTNIFYSSSVDFEGTPISYVLADVYEGSISDGTEEDDIVTAGSMKYQLLMIEQNMVCFFTEEGDMMCFTYQGNSIPTGTLSGCNILLVEDMNIENSLLASGGEINVELEGDTYTVDITDATINGKTYTLHYMGTLPYFDFPF